MNHLNPIIRLSALMVSTLFSGVIAAATPLGPAGVAENRDDAAMARLLQSYNPAQPGWTEAVTLETLINHYERTRDPKYLDLLQQAFRAQHAWRSKWYDDIGWYANAWLRAYDVTGDLQYLDEAKRIFQTMTEAWDGTCGGGIWWTTDRNYKNAITNELFLLAAARLHRRAPNGMGSGSYYDWAFREWQWFRSSGMINAQHRINDGLDASCKNNNGPTWSYNQGVVLGGLVELWRISGDRGYLFEAEQIAEATIKNQTFSTGVLQEACEAWNGCGTDGDGAMFKGIFAAGLARLYNADRGNKPAYGNFLLTNADRVWGYDRDASNTLGFNWNGPLTTPNKTSHASATLLIGEVALLNAGGETSTLPANGPVKVSEDCNYGGVTVALPAGSYTLNQLQAMGVGNDKISSLRVQNGYQATLYEHDNFAGRSVVKTGDSSCLTTDNFNDAASSLVIGTATTTAFSLLIQAENYFSNAGVGTETTSDTGGGLNVGWIDTGDWMAYRGINIPSNGSYVVEYRVASPGGGRLSLDLNAGAIQLGELAVPNTGGWQNWQTISQVVNLNAGTYNLGVFARAGGWNLNWLRITRR